MDCWDYKRREHAFKNEFNAFAGQSQEFSNFYDSKIPAEERGKIENYHEFICDRSRTEQECKICRKYNAAGIHMYILPHYDMDEFFDEFSKKERIPFRCYLFAMTENKFKELFQNHIYVANRTNTKIAFTEYEFPHLHFINIPNMLRIHLLLKEPDFMKNLK